LWIIFQLITIHYNFLYCQTFWEDLIKIFYIEIVFFQDLFICLFWAITNPYFFGIDLCKIGITKSLSSSRDDGNRGLKWQCCVIMDMADEHWRGKRGMLWIDWENPIHTLMNTSANVEVSENKKIIKEWRASQREEEMWNGKWKAYTCLTIACASRTNAAHKCLEWALLVVLVVCIGKKNT
jgi:hypothetical protein